MTSGGIADNVVQDTFQETATQYASKLIEKGAEALRGAARDLHSLGGAAAERAAPVGRQ